MRGDIHHNDHLHIDVRVWVSVDRRGSHRDVAWNGQGLESQPAPSLDQKWCEGTGNRGGDRGGFGSSTGRLQRGNETMSLETLSTDPYSL